MDNNINIKIKKGENNMSLIRKELAILGYEKLIDVYLHIHDFQPTNGKFIASRPWLKINKETKSFVIDYDSYLNDDFDANQRDIFINYLFTDEQIIDESVIEKLIGNNENKNVSQNFTKRLRSCEKFMFKQSNKKDKEQNTEREHVSNNENDKIFYKRKYAPTITKGPIDDICMAVSSKNNFKLYEDIFDVEEQGTDKILIENYGYEYLKDDISLSIDAIESDGEYIDNSDDLEIFKNQLDVKLNEASKYLSHDTEKLLRYIQTIRYIESYDKPVIKGYSANIEIDVDDILRAFEQKICPENRMKIFNQFIQLGNLNLNIKVTDGLNLETAKKKTKNSVLYFSSKLISLSFLISYDSKSKESPSFTLNDTSKLNDIDCKSVKNIKVKFSWTDTFEQLYKDGSEFLNQNMPMELFQLSRHKVKDFNLGMYISKLANSTLSNKKNKTKSSYVGFIKILKSMNMLDEIESTKNKSDKLKNAFKIIENVLTIYINNGIIKEETLIYFKENKKLVTAKNYKEFKIVFYYQNKSDIDKLIEEDLKK